MRSHVDKYDLDRVATGDGWDRGEYDDEFADAQWKCCDGVGWP